MHSSPSAPAALSYRPDIDGLRAIAVACVILRHANVRGFAGGFIGVDVFFVISGYLITALLQALPPMPMRARIGHFYLRRARRILPALFGCLLISTGIALVLQLPDQLAAFGRLLAFASVSLANIGVHLNGGYFAPSAFLSPLTPLWSIAVEEQFYLLYPLAFLLCARLVPNRLTLWVLIATVASCALCIWSSYAYPTIGYYLTPQRAWELLLGAAALLSQDSLRLGRIFRELAAAAAIAVILATTALYNSNLRYPGTATLAPALAAACLLVVNRGPAPTYVAKLLSLRPLVFTGLISYSLYLWHAPIFDFVQTYAVTPPTSLEIASLIGLLYLVATLSWRWIEVPFRSRQVLRNNVVFSVTAVALSVALLIAGAVMWESRGLPGRFDGYVQAVFRESPFVLGAGPCHQPSPEETAAGYLCHFGTDDSTAQKVVVWGDSHALALASGYEALAHREHLNLYLATEPGCRPLIGIVSANTSSLGMDVCRRGNQATLQAIERLQPDVIVLNAYWLKPSLKLWRDEAVANRHPILFQDALLATVRSIERPGRRLCVVFDVPNYPYQIPQALAMFHRRGKDTESLAMTRAQADLQQRDVESAFRSVAETDHLRQVNPRDALCAPGVCRLTNADNVSLYMDGQHLSRAGTAMITDTLAQCFAREQ